MLNVRVVTYNSLQSLNRKMLHSYFVNRFLFSMKTKSDVIIIVEKRDDIFMFLYLRIL